MTTTKAFIRPTNDQVVLQTLKEDKTTKGGIILPDSTRESCAVGRVFAVGRGLPVQGNTSLFHRPEPRQGDEVIYFKNRSTPFSIEGEEFRIIKAEDVLVIVNRLSPTELAVSDARDPLPRDPLPRDPLPSDLR